MEPEEEGHFVELVVVNINKQSRRVNNRINYSSSLLLRLVVQAQGAVIAQSLELARTEAVQNTIRCLGCSLSLDLPAAQEQYSWKLLIFGRQSTALDSRGQQLDLSESDHSGKKEMRKMGQCQINPFIYAEVFNECEKTKFQENISISNNLSIDYEVFIHRSREELERLLREESHHSEEMVDTAFKKRQGSRKVRYVELRDNREASLNSSEFSLAKKPQIASLRKEGQKYVPYKRQGINNNLGQRRRGQNNLQKRIKPLSSVPKEIRGNRAERSPQPARRERELVPPKGQKGSERGSTGYSKGCISWQGMSFLILLLVVGSFMMIPSRRI